MAKPAEGLAPGGLLVPNPGFGVLASDERIAAAAEALERNGFRALTVSDGQEARLTVLELFPDGAEVFNNTSRTLESIGVAEDIERSGRYQALRLRLYQMDREMQGREMRVLAASPEYVVGSVHAAPRAARFARLGVPATGASGIQLRVAGFASEVQLR